MIPHLVMAARLPLALLLAASLASCAEPPPPAAPPVPLADAITNDHGMTFILLPEGPHEVGSPDTERHREADEALRSVTLDRGVYIAITEVTQAQWDAVMPEGSNPSRFVGPDLPVDSVDWSDAQRFVIALSRRDGATYRLPTEAEWEVAARAGTRTAYHYGDLLTAGKANVREGDPTPKAGLVGGTLGKTAPVGSYEPNAWGLHDMHGNVWEWVADAHEEGGKIKRVLRGGAWNFSPAAARSATRMPTAPDAGYDCNGFRIVLDRTGG